jgi:hypothetical protein
VLREPLERSLSWFHLVNGSCPRVPWAASCAEATYLRYYSSPPEIRGGADATQPSGLLVGPID